MLSWPRSASSSPQVTREKMLSRNCAEKDLKEETPAARRRTKWITTVAVHMEPIGPYPPGSPTVKSALQMFKETILDVMAECGGTTEALSKDTVAGLFEGKGGNVQDVWQGIQAAFAVMDKIGEQNGNRCSQDRASIRLGIGVHSEPASPSATASQQSAAAPDNVKAEELSILNRQTPFPAIFISRSALTRLDGHRGYHIQPLGETPLHDRSESVPVYAMLRALQPE